MNIFLQLLMQSSRQYGVMLIRLVTAFMLARYVAPAEFGALAFVSLSVTLSWNFIDPGLKTRVLQDHDNGLRLLSQFHSYSTFTARLISALLVLTGLSGWMFDWWDSLYSLYIILFAVSTLFTGYGVMRYARLYHQKKISYLAKTDFFVQIPLAISAILFAYFEYQTIALIVFFIIPLWLHHSLIIRKVNLSDGSDNSFVSLVSIFRQNADLFMYQIEEQALRKVDSLILGWVSGPFWLGIYNRGYGLSLQASHLVQGVIQPIILPEKKNYQQHIIEWSSTGAAFLLFSIAFFADTWIPLIWGDEWIELIPLMPLFTWLGLSHLQIKLIDIQMLRDFQNAALARIYLFALILMTLTSIVSLVFFNIMIFFVAISVFFSMFAGAFSLKSSLSFRTKCIIWGTQVVLGWFGVASVWQ